MIANRVLLAHRDPAVRDLASRALAHIGVAVDVGDELAAGGYSVVVTERNDELLAAIAASPVRPVVIVTAPAADQVSLDPQVVSLFVPEPYDPQMLVGVILACVTPDVGLPPGGSPDARVTTT